MTMRTLDRRSNTARGAGQDRARSGETGRPLTDKAYEAIKREILECKLPPGSETTARELAARVGIGKVPLREALIRLGQEGLLQPIARSGYRITSVTVQDVEDIFALRLLLEPAAARQAAGRIDKELLSRLNELCGAGYEPGNRESESAFLRANREFHVAIAKASGNHRLARVLSQLLEETERLFHLGLAVRDRSDEMKHEHRELLDALVSGDGEAAACSIVEQIESARKMVMDGIMSAPWFRQASVVQW